MTDDPKILVFNITSSERLGAIRLTALRMGLSVKCVKSGELCLPLGYIAGLEGFDGTPVEQTGSFDDEMLVMCGLDRSELSELIDSLRSQNVTIPLKAMLTETNAKWSSLRLHREISAEHEAMKALSAKKHPIHRRKNRK